MDNQPLTFQEVEKILRIIDAAPKEGTFTIKLPDVKLSVTKGQKQSLDLAAALEQLQMVAQQPVHTVAAPQVVQHAPAAVPQADAQPPALESEPATSETPATASTSVNSDEPLHGHAVAAPLTGVFYRQPSPGADPFVVEGQRVEAGDVLAIIEVMKLMNRLTAPVSGVVTKILAENEDLIEHGNTLFVIDTSGGAS